MARRPRGAVEGRSADSELDGVLRRWRELGGRVTLQRRAILRVLVESDEHLTVAELLERTAAAGIEMDPSVLYRSLALFEESGLVHGLLAWGRHGWGLVEPPHHHGVCTTCRRVLLLPAAPFSDLVSGLEEASGLRLGPGGITVHGECASCST